MHNNGKHFPAEDESVYVKEFISIAYVYGVFDCSVGDVHRVELSQLIEVINNMHRVVAQ